MIDTVVERYHSNIYKHQVPAKTQLRESEKHTATFILSLADMSKYKSDAQRRKEINGLKFRILDRNDALQMTVCIKLPHALSWLTGYSIPATHLREDVFLGFFLFCLNVKV
jgi:hypothetical protein